MKKGSQVSTSKDWRWEVPLDPELPPLPPPPPVVELPPTKFKRQWRKHTIFILSAFIIGFIFLTFLEEVGVISSEQEQRFNVLLNFMAIVYAVALTRVVEEGWISKVNRLREAGIEIDSPESAAVEFYVLLKPYADAIKEAGIRPEDMQTVMQTMFKPAKKLPGGDIIDVDSIDNDTASTRPGPE